MTDQLITTAKALGGFAGRDEATQVDPLIVVSVLVLLLASILLVRALLALKPVAGARPSRARAADAGTSA